MKSFQVDIESKVANLETGLTLGEIYTKLWIADNLTITGGNCPSVGLGTYIYTVYINIQPDSSSTVKCFALLLHRFKLK